MVEPFNPAVPEGELEALRLRLRATRWPEAETDPSQGVALSELQELCAYWCDGYDWRRCEERLGQIGQFRTEIDPLVGDDAHAPARVREPALEVLGHARHGHRLARWGREPLSSGRDFVIERHV